MSPAAVLAVDWREESMLDDVDWSGADTADISAERRRPSPSLKFRVVFGPVVGREVWDSSRSGVCVSSARRGVPRRLVRSFGVGICALGVVLCSTDRSLVGVLVNISRKPVKNQKKATAVSY